MGRRSEELGHPKRSRASIPPHAGLQCRRRIIRSSTAHSRARSPPVNMVLATCCCGTGVRGEPRGMPQRGWREESCTSLCTVRSCAESGCCCAWAVVPMNGCCARSMTTQRVPAMAIASSRSSLKASACRLSVRVARDRRRARGCPTSLRRSSRRLLRSHPAARSGCTRSSSTVTAWVRVSSAARCG